MKRINKFALLFSLTAGLSTQAQNLPSAQRPGPSTTLKVGIGLSSEKITSDLNKTTTVGFVTNFKGEHTLLEGLILKADVSAILETGSTQSVYETNPYEPASRLSLKEALVNYRPWSFLSLDAGAISGRVHENELFKGDSPFIGFNERLSVAPGNVILAVTAFQGIPNNHNLAQRLGKVDEGEPRFFKETAEFEWHPEHFSLRSHFSHWAYSSLSTGVAYESRFLGNTISGLGKENSRFTTGFKGYEGMFEFSTIVFKNYELGVSYLAHVNDNARDKSKDSGYLLAPYTTILYGPGTTTLKFLKFELEADSIPAYYSSTKFGGTNKKGSGIEIEWKTLDESFLVKARYIKNEEIVPSSFQADEDIMMVELRRVYDIF